MYHKKEKESMFKYCDLHIHSHYSSATSPDMTVENIINRARNIGLHCIGTGDVLHEMWEREMRSMCEEKDGVFVHEDIEIIPSVEVNCKWLDRTGIKQAHILLIMRVQDIRDLRQLLSIYTVNEEEGRPTVGLSPHELRRMIPEHILFIPAHIFTPWYGIMGARCAWTPQMVLDLNPDALETGLSASRDMVYSIRELQSIPLVSFSDSHSLDSLAREITIIPPSLSIFDAVKKNGIITAEFPPEMGKYYETGHRKCRVTGRGICPVCGKSFTVGVKEMVERYENTVWEKDWYMLPYHSVLKKMKRVVYEVPGKDVEVNLGTRVFEDDEIAAVMERVHRKQLKFVFGYDGKYGDFYL